MAAHDLPIVAMVALLVMAMVVWTGARAGLGAALLAPLLLLTSPRFFADSFNNLKDVPEAVLFTGALLVAARAIRGGGRGAWLLAGSLGGAALAQKTNAIFLPIELLAWLLLCLLLRLPVRAGGERPGEGRERRDGRDVALTVFAFVAVYFALSPQYWFDPFARLRLHWSHVLRIGNVAVRAAEFGNDSVVARLKIDPDALLEVVFTTPIPVLVLFVVGLFAPTLPGRDRALLLTAAVVPIARALAPGMVNFDGVRHFDEFFPPMCILAASGLAWLARLASRAARGARSSPPRAGAPVGIAAAAAVTLAALAPGAWATIASHPNGCAWFNAFVGGLRGAQQRDLRDATDYWGNSYWQAAAWLNEHAEPRAAVVAPVASHVLLAIAPVRLRANLRTGAPDAFDPEAPIYVVYLTRRRFYDALTVQLDRDHAPVHEVLVDGAPILRIHRLAAGAEAGAALAELRDLDFDTLVRRSIVAAWEKATPTDSKQIREVIRRHKKLSHDEALRQLRALLPPDLAVRTEEFLRALEADDRTEAPAKGK